MNIRENNMPRETKVIEHRIVERIEYCDRYPYERSTRTLYEDDVELYSETDSTGAMTGKLADIVRAIWDLSAYKSEDKCRDCRYKVGEYRGDIGYLLYLAFRYRLRSQWVAVKLRLSLLAERYLGLRRKTPQNREM